MVSDCLISLCSGVGLFDFIVLWFQIVSFHNGLVSDLLISLCSVFKLIDFIVMASDV